MHPCAAPRAQVNRHYHDELEVFTAPRTRLSEVVPSDRFAHSQFLVAYYYPHGLNGPRAGPSGLPSTAPGGLVTVPSEPIPATSPDPSPATSAATNTVAPSPAAAAPPPARVPLIVHHKRVGAERSYDKHHISAPMVLWVVPGAAAQAQAQQGQGYAGSGAVDAGVQGAGAGGVMMGEADFEERTLPSQFSKREVQVRARVLALVVHVQSLLGIVLIVMRLQQLRALRGLAPPACVPLHPLVPHRTCARPRR